MTEQEGILTEEQICNHLQQEFGNLNSGSNQEKEKKFDIIIELMKKLVGEERRKEQEERAIEQAVEKITEYVKQLIKREHDLAVQKGQANQYSDQIIGSIKRFEEIKSELKESGEYAHKAIRTAKDRVEMYKRAIGKEEQTDAIMKAVDQKLEKLTQLLEREL